MKARKTVKVGDVLERANHILKYSPISQEVREGVEIVLESILHDTGNYEGYQEFESSEGAKYRHYFMSKTTMDDVLEFQEVREKQGGLR